MNKQWIYRNGDKPFSVTEIETPNGEIFFTSARKDGLIFNHNPPGDVINYSGYHHYDLIPYEPYAGFKIDDEVYVYDDDDGDKFTKETAHFAGIDKEGNPTAFRNGGTSFTRNPLEIDSWDHCEKANKEDK
jgi:hypothetical protein